METRRFLLTSSYYPPYHVGGACIHVYHLANKLASFGHEVHVIYSLDWYYLKWGKVNPVGSYPNHQNIILHPLKSPIGRLTPFLAYSFGYYFPLSRKIIQEIKTIEPDIIHHHNITGLGPFILEGAAQKRIYTAHDYYLICQIYSLFKDNKYMCNKARNCAICSTKSKKPPQVWRTFYSLKKLLSKIDVIIAPSGYMKEKLCEFGVENNMMKVISNFVPSPPEKIEDSAFSNYFLFAGRLGQHKGILDLLNVFKRFHDEFDAKLIIVGSGPLEKQIKEFIAKYNLQNKIIFLGWADKEILYPLYKDALAVIVPSTGPENNPLVALEALSVGTPVTGSDQGGIPEIVEKVDYRLIFRAGDLESMKRVLVEYARRKYSVEKIKAVYEKWYSVEGYISRYFDLLDRI